MKFYKILFLNSLILGTLISISAYSWFSMWMGLEINMLSFIPLINKKNSVYSSEASIKYFIIQSLASIFILFSIIMMLMMNEYISKINLFLSMILNSSLLTKMGAAPFHYWMPEVMEGLNWLNCLILLTWQKIAPMILLFYNQNLNFFMFIIIIMCMVVSGIMGWNQISIRKLMTYSSINHIGWMISLSLFNQSLWMIYFLIYSFISTCLIMLFNKFKIYFMSQLFFILKNNPMLKLFMILNLFSLGGLPPFLGFFPKWLAIKSLIDMNFMTLALIMVFFTLITLYFYLRISISSLTLLNMDFKKLNFKTLNYFYVNFFMFMNITGMILMPILWNF